MLLLLLLYYSMCERCVSAVSLRGCIFVKPFTFHDSTVQKKTEMKWTQKKRSRGKQKKTNRRQWHCWNPHNATRADTVDSFSKQQHAASEATTKKINSQIDMSVRLRVFGANEKLYIFFFGYSVEIMSAISQAEKSQSNEYMKWCTRAADAEWNLQWQKDHRQQRQEQPHTARNIEWRREATKG